jgi:hypothetical protein
MSTLGATAPHYVRCIKPNTLKQPSVFDDEMVLAQLRYLIEGLFVFVDRSSADGSTVLLGMRV